MIWGTSYFKVMNRLLAAALLCFAVVLSQMAHANVSPLGDTATAQAFVEATDKSIVEGDGYPHSSAEESSADHEHGGKVDPSSCASKCPANFVPAHDGGASNIWDLRADPAAFDMAFKGSLVALLKDPQI